MAVFEKTSSRKELADFGTIHNWLLFIYRDHLFFSFLIRGGGEQMDVGSPSGRHVSEHELDQSTYGRRKREREKKESKCCMFSLSPSVPRKPSLNLQKKMRFGAAQYSDYEY